jgi:hypothetical protein
VNDRYKIASLQTALAQNLAESPRSVSQLADGEY